VQGVDAASAKKLRKQPDNSVKMILVKAKKAAKKHKISAEGQAAITDLIATLRQELAGA
jgi:hypothetical protein